MTNDEEGGDLRFCTTICGAMTSSHQELTKWNREILEEAMLREASFRMLENFVDVPCFAK